MRTWTHAVLLALVVLLSSACQSVEVGTEPAKTCILLGLSCQTGTALDVRLPVSPEEAKSLRFVVCLNAACSSGVVYDATPDAGRPCTFTGDLAIDCVLTHHIDGTAKTGIALFTGSSLHDAVDGDVYRLEVRDCQGNVVASVTKSVTYERVESCGQLICKQSSVAATEIATAGVVASCAK